MGLEREREALAQAAAVLPQALRAAVLALPGGGVEELRLRAGQPLGVVTAAGESPVGPTVSQEDLERTLEGASQCSAYAVVEQMRQGYLTIRGGHRLGLCGTGVVRDGQVAGLRQVSSLALRVAHEVPGVARGLLPGLLREGAVQSTLILSPPGWGKTTLLRDLIRCLSDGDGLPSLRVGVADERRELAALWGGQPQLAVGGRTDVVEGCPKAAALLMLLRGMNPQVLAADELTDPADAAALEQAAGCGVALLATAHAGGVEDLRRRPIYRALLEREVFQRLVVIGVQPGGSRTYRVLTAEGEPC